MKKSELIKKLIEIEEQEKLTCSITMNYITYLNKLKNILEIGDVEL